MVVADLRVSPDSGTRIDSFSKQELLSPELRCQIETQLPSDDNDLKDEINRLLKEAVNKRLTRQRPGVATSSLVAFIYTEVNPPYLFADNVRAIISMLDQTRIEQESWRLTLRALRAADRVRRNNMAIILGNNPQVDTIWEKSRLN